MKTSKTVKINTLRDSDLHKDSLSFPIGSTVAISMKMVNQWIYEVIQEANKSDFNGRSYIVRVVKTGRLKIQNTRHIYSTPITTKKYI